MANQAAPVPYNPVPQVSPSAQGTDDYIHVQATPAAFGAGIGQAEAQAGAQSQQLAGSADEVAIRAQNLFNEAAVNKAQASWMDQQNDLLYSPQNGFYAKKGMNAAASQQDTLAALDKLRQQAGAGLANDRQKLMFDQITRRIADWNKESMSRHATQEANNAAHQDYVSVMASTANAATFAGMSGDVGPNSNFAQLLKEGMDQTSSWQDRAGYGPEWGDSARQTWVGQVVKNTALQIAKGGDIKSATALVDRYATAPDGKPMMDKGSLLDVRSKLKDSADYAQAHDLVTAVNGQFQQGLNNPSGSAPAFRDAAGTPGIDAFRNATHIQESGGKPGDYQIQPGTWAQYAKSGEKPVNPDDQKAVFERITSDLEKRTGGDPERMAVGYFSGPGNIAPAGSPTPWVSDLKDKNGKSVSSYVQDVSGRLANGGALNPGQVAKVTYGVGIEEVRRQAQAIRPGDHDFEDRAVSLFQQEAARTETAQRQADQVKLDIIHSALNGSNGVAPTTEAELRRAGGPVGDALDALLASGRMSRSSLDSALLHNAKGAQDVPANPDNQREYYRLMGMSANDHDGFATEDLMKYYGKIPGGQWQQLVNMQTAISRKDAGQADRTQLLNNAMTNQGVKIIFERSHLFPPKAGVAASDDYAEATGRLTTALSKWKEDNPGKGVPSDEELQKMAADITQKVKVKGTIWDSTVPLYRVNPVTRDNKSPVGLDQISYNIPADFAAEAEAQLKRAGRPVTPDMITAVYHSYLAKRGIVR